MHAFLSLDNVGLVDRVGHVDTCIGIGDCAFSSDVVVKEYKMYHCTGTIFSALRLEALFVMVQLCFF